MTQIRVATEADFEAAYEAAVKYHKLTPYFPSTELNKDKLFEQFHKGLEDQTKYIVLLAEQPGKGIVGMLIGHAGEIVFSDRTIATEMIWNADTGKVLMQLYHTYSYWAKNIAKVDMLSCGAYVESASKFLSRQGMKPVEQFYIKELK
jgi:hypothetical protein